MSGSQGRFYLFILFMCLAAGTDMGILRNWHQWKFETGNFVIYSSCWGTSFNGSSFFLPVWLHTGYVHDPFAMVSSARLFSLQPVDFSGTWPNEKVPPSLENSVFWQINRNQQPHFPNQQLVPNVTLLTSLPIIFLGWQEDAFFLLQLNSTTIVVSTFKIRAPVLLVGG